MASSIFVPRKISVGFQKREGTYTGKLAYVVYTDEKNVLRKKQSWETWRHKNIDPLETDNVPTSGFVLNKKAGGYATHWDVRQTYVRVYDPRGFEIEVTIPNLMYILENASCIKGKGLEGDFVYGWEGTELLLIPTDAPDYAEMIAYRDTLFDKDTVKTKELILGATYMDRKGTKLVYMGRYNAYDDYRKGLIGKRFFFWTQYKSYDGKLCDNFETKASLSGKLVSVVDETPHPEYAQIFERLERTPTYSPADEKLTKYIPFTYTEFEKHVGTGYYGYFCDESGKQLRLYRQHPKMVRPTASGGPYYGNNWNYDYNKFIFTAEKYNDYYAHSDTEYTELKHLFDALKPQHRDTYLTNGKFYRRDF